MTVAASLMAYGLLLAGAGPQLLGKLHAARRAPRLGIVLWQVATASVVLSWALAGLALVLPFGLLDDLGHFFTFCLTAVHQLAAASPGGASRLAGLSLAALVIGRAAGCVGSAGLTASRRRRTHARTLYIVARRSPELGSLVIDHPEPAIYCLPGRPGETVVTTGALRLLSPGELAAALAHESAHLRARHHLAILVSSALTRAFPKVPLMAAAAREVPMLVEMCADDAAARQQGRTAVLGALQALARMRSPEGMLAASGSAVAARIERLAIPARRLFPRVSLGSAVALLSTGPLVAAAIPAIVLALDHAGYCPVPPLS